MDSYGAWGAHRDPQMLRKRRAVASTLCFTGGLFRQLPPLFPLCDLDFGIFLDCVCDLGFPPPPSRVLTQLNLILA